MKINNKIGEGRFRMQISTRDENLPKRKNAPFVNRAAPSKQGENNNVKKKLKDEECSIITQQSNIFFNINFLYFDNKHDNKNSQKQKKEKKHTNKYEK